MNIYSFLVFTITQKTIFEKMRDSDSETSSTNNSDSSTEFTPNSDPAITSNSDTSIDSNDAEDPFKNWYEYCVCTTDYRGELEETHCPNCLKMVVCDVDESSSVDWSVIERNCKITNRFSKSLEDFFVEIGVDFSEKTDTIVDEEVYFADDEKES